MANGKSNSNKLTIQLDIHQLKSEKINALKDHLKSFKGDKPIFFDVYDSEKKIKLTLNSKKIKVKIIPELLSRLEDHEWFYKLN